MWSDAAREAAALARSGSAGGSVAPQAGSAQAAAGGVGRTAGGSAPSAANDTPAHSEGVAAVARSMNNPDTRSDKTSVDHLKAASEPIGSYQTQEDRNTINNISTRNYANSTMVGDHTSPLALQKYLD